MSCNGVCDFQNICKKYSLGKCEYPVNGREFENCSDYIILDHFERKKWISFEMMTPAEFNEID